MTNVTPLERLAITKAYCDVRFDGSDVKGSLRTPTTLPKEAFFPDVDDHLRSSSFDDWYRLQLVKNISIVDDVLYRRSKLYSPPSAGGAPVRSLFHPAAHVLLYSPSLAGGDGLASGDSEGLFDRDDSPPWDTYFAYVCLWRLPSTELVVSAHAVGDLVLDGVLCWIPEAALPYAEHGAKCTPADSLTWLGNLDVKYQNALEEWFVGNR